MATRDPRGDGTGAVTTGGGTEPMAPSAAVHPNASSHPRPDAPPLLRKLAAWSWRLLAVTAIGRRVVQPGSEPQLVRDALPVVAFTVVDDVVGVGGEAERLK